MSNVQQAIQDLHINVPLYKIVEREDGTIQLTTRDGVFEWMPRPPSPFEGEGPGVRVPSRSARQSRKPRS